MLDLLELLAMGIITSAVLVAMIVVFLMMIGVIAWPKEWDPD